MKKHSFLSLIGIVAMGVGLVGGSSALASPVSLTFYSDYQTYVISSTAASTMLGTSLADTNFYGKGAMMISAENVTAPGTPYAENPRAMDSLFSFNTAVNQTGTVGQQAYSGTTGGLGATGMDIVSAYNAQFGANNWTITGVTISLASNWRQEGRQPNNYDFNPVASGEFEFQVLGSDPNLTTITWNSLQNSVLPNTTATSVGTFEWNALATAPDGGATFDLPDQVLTVNQALIDAILSGEFTLLGVAADDEVGYVFNTKNRLAPMITITADASPVPVPGAVWLLGSGLLGVIGLRKKRELM